VDFCGPRSEGLFVSFGSGRQDGRLIACDSVVPCAGQKLLRELHALLVAAGVAVHPIGGADAAAELDAERAIVLGTRLAATL